MSSIAFASGVFIGIGISCIFAVILVKDAYKAGISAGRLEILNKENNA